MYLKPKIMGFPGHFRIPGHSGTDQKHKKAFTKWRKWQREDAFTYEGGRKESQRTGQYESEHVMPSSAKKWLLRLGLPIATIALISSGWLIFQAGDGMMSAFDQIETITLAPENDTERLQAYKYYRGLANQALEEGNYEAGRVNYTHALNMAPYSKSARLGLTIVLEHYCEKDQIYCEEAAEQRNFMNKMGWRSNI